MGAGEEAVVVARGVCRGGGEEEKKEDMTLRHWGEVLLARSG